MKKQTAVFWVGAAIVSLVIAIGGFLVGNIATGILYVLFFVACIWVLMDAK